MNHYLQFMRGMYKWLMGVRVKKRDGREEMRRREGAEGGKRRQERCNGMVVSCSLILHKRAFRKGLRD